MDNIGMKQTLHQIGLTTAVLLIISNHSRENISGGDTNSQTASNVARVEDQTATHTGEPICVMDNITALYTQLYTYSHI